MDPIRFLRAAVAAVVLACASVAQTSGVPGINDYTLAGSTGPGCFGSPSCITCCYPTPTVVTGTVSTGPGRAVFFIWSFCPCTPGFICGPTNACAPPIPLTACGSATNQSFDILLGCVTSTNLVLSNSAGQAQFTLTLPTLGPACASATLSTQAVIVDNCGLGVAGFPGPFVLTQAYSVNF